MESAKKEEEMIKETVLEMLNSSNMSETTEFMIRKAASDKLGIDLSTPHFKLLVRNVVQSFLLTQQQQLHNDENDHNDIQEEDEDVNEDDDIKTKTKVFDDDGDLIICKLSDKRRVTIQDFKGKTLVSMREYYKKDGKELPTAKGISLTAEQWSTFKKNVPAIEKAIKTMEARLQ